MPDTEDVDLKIPQRAKDWDEYFYSLAQAVATKSKDPRSQVGAVVVSEHQVVLSTGFNGLARGVSDDEAILGDVDEKLRLVCHAEANAVYNAARVGAALEGATIYVNKFPCLACCNLLIQAGIRRVFTLDHRYWKDDPFDKEHTRKRLVLQYGGIMVHAPNHPDFSIPALHAIKTDTTDVTQSAEVPERKPPASVQRLENVDGLQSPASK